MKGWEFHLSTNLCPWLLFNLTVNAPNIKNWLSKQEASLENGAIGERSF